MKVIQFFVPNSFNNFNYIIYDEMNSEAYIIDPFDASLVMQKLSENTLTAKAIINTHYHGDHTRASDELSQKLNVKILPNDFDEIKFTNGLLKCLKTPGHTPDHVVFVGMIDDQQQFIISGDTIFNAGVGNCKNGGNVEQLFETINFLNSSLSNDAILYPSHDYFQNNLRFATSLVDNPKIKQYLNTDYQNTTIGKEREINLFFQTENKNLQNILHAQNSKEAFIKLRSLRDKW